MTMKSCNLIASMPLDLWQQPYFQSRSVFFEGNGQPGLGVHLLSLSFWPETGLGVDVPQRQSHACFRRQRRVASQPVKLRELHIIDLGMRTTIPGSPHRLMTLVGIYRNRNDDLKGTIVTYIGRLSRLESVLFYFCNSKKRTQDGIDRDTDVVGFLPSFHGATDMGFHRG